MTKLVPCPYCKKEVEYSLANPYRPFCSERCRLIDLGEWASENYRVPTSERAQDENSQSPQNDEEDDDLETKPTKRSREFDA